MAHAPTDDRVPEPGSLYAIVRGRRAPFFVPSIDGYREVTIEQRGDRGAVLRVLSAATWPLVLCRLEWDAATDGGQPSAAPTGFMAELRALELAQSQLRRPGIQSPGGATRPRHMYDFAELRLRRVSEDFLATCRTGRVPEGP